MDLFEDPAPNDQPSGNQPEYTVSELAGAVKRVIEGEFGLVRVRGEVGRVSRPASGHLYFDLKDDRAVIAAISWKGQVARMQVRPEEGMEVVATGRMTTFPGQSKYQLIVEDVSPAGAGALMAMLEKRKTALAAEGLFDPARKQALPYLPEIIGVITSPSGAVIRDILHRLRDRFPRHVLVWPVAVQGQTCAAEVARAIAGFNALPIDGPIPRPEVLIVARGGGSIEDLWGFNEEIVVRAAAASLIPLISAVGHETDTTLIDYAADVRAPTPSAAAELAVPVRLDLVAHLDGLGARLSRALTQGVALRGQRLRDLARALPRAEVLTDQARQRLDFMGERLPLALRAATARKRLQLADLVLRPGVLRRILQADQRQLTGSVDRLAPALDRLVRSKRQAFDARGQRLRLGVLQQDLTRKRDSFATVLRRLITRAERSQEGLRSRLAALDRMHQSLGYEATLARGYTVVRGDGAVVTGVKAATAAATLEIQFADGRLVVGSKPKKPKVAKPDQGSLF